MGTLANITLAVEFILLIAMSFGSYYGRKLNMKRHHYILYPTLFVQAILVASVMIPSALYLFSMNLISPLLVFHMIMGVITAIGSLVLVIVFLRQRNEFDLPTLRWTKPLMIFVFFTWIISFLLGCLVFLNAYILS